MSVMIDPKVKDGFRIQGEVIKALLLREMLTRWGRRNIGFLWVLFEPLIIIFVITIIIFFIRSYTGAQTYRLFGVDLLAFLITGYNIAYLWRRTPTMCAAGISANRGLLTHRNVKPFDLFFTRYILEMVGVTLSFILMISGFVSFNIIPAPVSYELMVAAWLLTMWFAFGLSLTIAPIISQSQNLNYIWLGISIVLVFLSGSFYLVDWLPAKLQAILIWNPILSGTEMLRHGYFGDSIKTFEEPFYLIKWNLFLTLLGLYMVRSKFLLNQSS
jgi:capsular polysaccharide transport system permease protein